MDTNYGPLQNFFRYIREHPLEIFLYCLLTAAAFKVFTLYVNSEMDNEEWQRYKVEHNCHERISVSETKISSWECDNGEVFFNWRQQR